jgi:hypothetical protein
MNGRTLLVSLFFLILVGVGAVVLQGVMKGSQDPSPAVLLALVDGLLDATDPCGAVIENDPEFRRQLRTKTVRDGKLTQAGLAQAWQQSINLVETGSLAPDIQTKVDQRIPGDEVKAYLELVSHQYETLQAQSNRYGDGCRDLLATFEVALQAAESLVDVALDPGSHVAWAKDYSLMKFAMMNSLETFVDGVARLSGQDDLEGRQRFLEASTAFMISPVMDYYVSNWEK